MKRKQHDLVSAQRLTVRSIGAGRIGVGVVGVVKPKLIGSVAGRDGGMYTRMWGLREIFIGSLAQHPSEIVWRTALRWGVALDAADAAAIIASAKNGAPLRDAVPGAAIAIGAAVAGAAGPGRILRKQNA